MCDYLGIVICVVEKERTANSWAGKCEKSFDLKSPYGISLIDKFHLLVSMFLPVCLVGGFTLSGVNAFMS